MIGILFANIGNRDIGIEDKPIYALDRNQNIYEDSKELWNRIHLNPVEIEKYEAILLGSIFDYFKENGINLSHVYLFRTKQIPPHPKDTYYMAEIIKKILTIKYHLKEGEITLNEITTNPSDRDKMYEFYNNYFENFPEPENDKIIYISTTGGTPAQNEMMLLTLVIKFGEKLQVVYKPADSELKLLKIGEIITKNLYLREFNALKNNNHLAAAIELAEKYSLATPHDLNELKGEYYRMLFDFKSAIEYFEKAKDAAHGEDRGKIEEKIEELEKLQSLSELKEFNKEYFTVYLLLIKELYKNMEIKLREGAYVDFIGRLYRMKEALLRFVFEFGTGYSTRKEGNEYPDFKQFLDLEENKEIKSHLEEEIRERHGETIKYETTTDNLEIIIGYLCKKYSKEKDQSKLQMFGKIYDFSKSIKNLMDIRNQTILAHGFKGVSKETIERNYKNKPPEEIIKKIEDIINNIENILSET